MEHHHPVHPLRSQARILLSSVFGPYAVDDEYGSRSINPMELYHNQVTREQGPFSLRMFHRSFGLMLLKENIDAPCTLLDFPSLERFVEEISLRSYDIIGISAIIPNIEKVRKMCELIRAHQPQATIVVGGHIANLPGLKECVDCDHVCRGEGVRWFRAYLGLDVETPVRHPYVYSGYGTRILGVNPREIPENTAAMLIPSVGCPVGCNFCSTSALFGGKGRFVNFFETGDELFRVMCDIEEVLRVSSFFVMDENFLLHRSRALRLLELMKQHRKAWALFVFSSARVLRTYTVEQLLRLGISWVWMGLEGEASTYRKLSGVDTKALVAELQSHGIRVLGSTIIGLESHTPENIDAVIDHAVGHNTVFHQFMLYTPIPGTPLYEHHRRDGSLLGIDERPHADNHGQYRFNYRHTHIKDGQETGYLKRAFTRDFEENGPSLARMIRTMLNGWMRHKDHPDPCVRARLAKEISPLKTTYAAAVWAMQQWYRHDPRMHAMMNSILSDLYREFGWKTRILAPLMGVVAFLALGREQQRLVSGRTYEPKTFYEKNSLALGQEVAARTVAAPVPSAPARVCVDLDLPVHSPMPPEAAPPRAL
ncbi:MAG TPA: cobalamin-dependent protein [Deltaproteobacteria bacterium]|mgnify:CR=1 FL=1|nr:cobalamin-dependent protein [Deltaproteobacteria bacterium]HQI80120.1 cobalamin-dependent protein [Deltaproteobacteria bacterium]